MKRTNSQSERQNYIDLQIRVGKYPSIFQLSADLEVSDKTIKRDIEFMRDRLCVPIEYHRKNRGYYYSEQTWGIPALIMTKSELKVVELAKAALIQTSDYESVVVFEQFLDRLLKGVVPAPPGRRASNPWENVGQVPDKHAQLARVAAERTHHAGIAKLLFQDVIQDSLTEPL